jgi:hypothetical protein
MKNAIPLKQTNYTYPIFYFLIGLLYMSCTNDPARSSKAAGHKYTFTLGEDILKVDSVHANVWFEEELDKNMLTLKIYITSSYPLEDKSVIRENGFMRISAQSIAEPGTHFIKDTGTSWNNDLAYEFPLSSTKPERSLTNSIYIPEIDFDKKRLTCKVNISEYLSLQEIMAGKKGTRLLVFYGESIPFEVE